MILSTKSQEYNNIHYWLRNTFGKAARCQSNICQGRSKSYHYALRKGCEHGYDIHSYMRLCQSCHAFYDMPKKRSVQASRKGEGHNNSKLTEKDVLEIRRDYVPRKISAPMLGKKYGVCASAINLIISRKNWKHI